MKLVIGIAIGFILGILVGALFFYSRIVGNLRIDHSDPTSEPYMFLELGTDFRTVARSKYVTLKVRVEDFMPHK